MNKRKKITIIIYLSIIIVNLTMFIVGYVNYLYPKLGDYHVLGVNASNNLLLLELDGAHNATRYEVTLSNKDKEVYKTNSNSPKIPILYYDKEYNESYDVKVLAYNKNNSYIERDYTYINKDPSFIESEKYFDSSLDINLKLKGYKKDSKYKIEILYKDKMIYSDAVTSEYITIPKEKVMGYSGELKAVLKNDYNRILNEFKFYLNMPMIGNLHITSPSNNYITRWDDIVLKYDGGENSNRYKVLLYQEGILVNDIDLESINNEVTIPADCFMEDNQYDIVLKAYYDDYLDVSKEDSIHVTISKKETTNPVYVTHNPTFIKAGTSVELKSRTSNAFIYYTTDGSEPDTNSNLYTKPIIINEDTLIKTYAVTNNRYDSVVNTYDFKVRDKNLVFYLSPSNQYLNYGNSDAGYTTEMEIMNRIADVVQQNLTDKGVIVYRNVPSAGINAWNAESNYVKADFHLAIHSNASGTRLARGIEIYVDKETSKALSIASVIYENLWQIYDGNDNPLYNRGIKYARGSLGEVNEDFLPCGSLIEVAYHDQYDDALWIMQNIENIGNNIANSIYSYYN